MYIYVYTYIYTYICTYIYIFISIYIACRCTANVMRLCKRLRPTERFSCLQWFQSLENEEFTSKTALSKLLLLTQVAHAGLPAAHLHLQIES